MPRAIFSFHFAWICSSSRRYDFRNIWPRPHQNRLLHCSSCCMFWVTLNKIIMKWQCNLQTLCTQFAHIFTRIIAWHCSLSHAVRYGEHAAWLVISRLHHNRFWHLSCVHRSKYEAKSCIIYYHFVAIFYGKAIEISDLLPSIHH